MEQTELRLGNYIQYKDKSYLLRVSQLGGTFATETDFGIEYGSIDLSDYNPVIINDDILERLGFEEEPIGHSIIISDFGSITKLCIIGGNLALVHSESRIDIPKSIILLWQTHLNGELYLHNLQNIYQALTKKELEIIDKLN